MNLRQSSFAIVFLIISLFFFQCKKNSEFGIDLLPPDDASYFKTDSFDLRSFTVKDTCFNDNSTAAISASEFSKNTPFFYPYVSLGYISDDIFGSMNCNFLADYTVSTVGFDPADISSVDSLNLILNVDTTSIYPSNAMEKVKFKFRVYELKDTLGGSRTSSSEVDKYVDLNSITIADTEIDIFNPRSISNKSTITIPLNDGFIEKIKTSSIDTFKYPPALYKYFKGIYVECSKITDDNLLLRVNLKTGSKIQLKYKDKSSVEKVLDLDISSFNNRYGVNKNTYSATIQNYLDDATNDDSLLYIQGCNSLAAKIDIDTLGKRPKGYFVMDAKLSIPAGDSVSTMVDVYPRMAKLTIYGLVKGQFESLSGYYNNGQRVGCYYDKKK